MVPITETIEVPDEELRWSFARSAGPGGQKVQKVATKATLRWDVARTTALPPEVKDRFLRLYKKRITTEGELVLSSQRFRTQERNRADCLEKLAELVRQAAALPKPRRPTKPTRAAKRRRVEAKRRRSAVKAARREPSGEE